MAAEYKNRASNQLDSIVAYIAKASPQNALRMFNLIYDAAEFLDRNPGVGRLRNDLGIEIRTWPVSSFVLVYRERSDGGVLIIGIAHGRQLLEALLEEP